MDLWGARALRFAVELSMIIYRPFGGWIDFLMTNGTG